MKEDDKTILAVFKKENGGLSVAMNSVLINNSCLEEGCNLSPDAYFAYVLASLSKTFHQDYQAIFDQKVNYEQFISVLIHNFSLVLSEQSDDPLKKTFEGNIEDYLDND